jgi:hypothetical protein
MASYDQKSDAVSEAQRRLRLEAQSHRTTALLYFDLARDEPCPEARARLVSSAQAFQRRAEQAERSIA